jgi:hypothetical protein
MSTEEQNRKQQNNTAKAAPSYLQQSKNTFK